MSLTIPARLRLAANVLERTDYSTRVLRHWDAKTVLLAALDDIDRELEYGNPGFGLNELLSEEKANG